MEFSYLFYHVFIGGYLQKKFKFYAVYYIELLNFAPLAQLVEQLTLNQLKQVLSEFETTIKNPPLKTRVFHLPPIVSNVLKSSPVTRFSHI